MLLKYFFDLMSEPCRAIYIFLKLTNIPFEPCPVALRKGVNLTEEFKQKYNKFQKVPFIHDDNFILTESIAILRYLSTKYNVTDPWYPSDVIQRARVDEYLEWHQNNTRALCSLYVQKKWLNPLTTGEKTLEETLVKCKTNMKTCLDQIERIWLGEGNKFITGDEITIADIFAICEIEQIKLTGYNPKEGRPNLANWWNRVKLESGPVYSEAHFFVDRLYDTSVKSKL